MFETDHAKTAAELLRMPDDGIRYELVRGELRRMSPAGSRHGVVALAIAASLRQHVTAKRLGLAFAAETGFLLTTDPDTVRAPDAAFVAAERVPSGGAPEGYWPGAPDLAAEVLSPSDRFSEVQEKVLQWLDAGCRMVLLIDPRQHTVTVFRSRERAKILGAADTLDGDDVVPGWSLTLRELFG